jgi:hypothetical protein
VGEVAGLRSHPRQSRRGPSRSSCAKGLWRQCVVKEGLRQTFARIQDCNPPAASSTSRCQKVCMHGWLTLWALAPREALAAWS